MKKLFIVILAFLYLNISSGVVINLHYCMGKLASVEYGYDDHDACGKCGMKENKGCCNTEYKVVKLQDAHQLAKADFNVSQAVPSTIAHEIDFIAHTAINRDKHPTGYHSPPDKKLNAVYLYNGVFRI